MASPEKPSARSTWIPTADEIAATNIAVACSQLGLKSYDELYRWSIDDRSRYWQFIIQRLKIHLDHPYSRILDLANGIQHPQWLTGAKLNIVNSCLNGECDRPAIYWPRKDREELNTTTYGQLAVLANRVSNGLATMGVCRGDTIAIMMPMNTESVALYLGVIQAGCAVVSIADSFAPDQIAMRLRIAAARLLFTQDFVSYGKKKHPLYARTADADPPDTVVLLTNTEGKTPLRNGDLTWEQFLPDNEQYIPMACGPNDTINILFSSGTTDEPKAIPWNHTTPIKCAADGHFHHDIQPGDVTCWPTNLGWMMGPWLIFATLINRGTMAIYDSAATEPGFGRFVQNARVNMLGVVPSLVRSWRDNQTMAEIDWSAIKLFSSTGECSNAQDMKFLMSLADNRPVIEYCGGTEIGGGYITGTPVQTAIAATFSTPALGMSFRVLDSEGSASTKGEVFIDGPSIGLSTQLLNRDHDQVYFKPAPSGTNLRCHGDQIECLPGGYYRVLGRADDTMNLGGIKIGSAEIERVLCNIDNICETAAISINPPDGGPEHLVIYVVLDTIHPPPIDQLTTQLQQAIRTHLNPLFKIHRVYVLDQLPRTVSNKVMRRKLRHATHLNIDPTI